MNLVSTTHNGHHYRYAFPAGHEHIAGQRIEDDFYCGKLSACAADVLLDQLDRIVDERVRKAAGKRSIASRLRRAVSRMIDRWCEAFLCSGTGNRSSGK